MSVYVKIHVHAGAKKEIFIDRGEGRYDIAVREKAEQNQANARVRELIAKQFGVPVGKVRIHSGHHAPGKILLVDI